MRFYEDDDLELEVDGTIYSVAFYAEAEYCYSEGCSWRGENSYPSDSEFDITEINADWYAYDENDEAYKIEPTPRMEVALENYLWDLDIDF